MITSSESLEYDTVILGGGFAGIACARALSASSTAKVCLIAEENYTVFQPMLPEVAAGSISPRHVVNPIRQFCSNTQVVRGSVHRIDNANQFLEVDIGPHSPEVKIRFQHLVVCPGAQIDLSRVPGMSEHALLMRNIGDAMKLRVAILSRFEEANWIQAPLVKETLLRFVIVGGGYSGVETAGQLQDLIATLPKFYNHISPEDVEVVLVHSRDHLLPTLNARLQTYALKKLRKRGVRVILEQRVRSITAQAVCLQDGTRLDSATVVSTVGNAPHPIVINLMAQLGLEEKTGRLPTDVFGRVQGTENLWSAGDCAYFPLSDGTPCPATAQFAQRQGRLIGKNLQRLAKGKALKPFRFTGLGEFAAIGHHNAVGEVKGIRISGFFAWWLWRTIYLAKLPTLQRKLRVVIDWTFDLFFPRDLNLLDPHYSSPMNEIRLEVGDVLFNPGDPAYSLYLVKSGAMDILDGDSLVKTVTAGESFGERALLMQKNWLYQARCREEAFLVALPAKQFHTIVGTSPALKELFTRSAIVYQSHHHLTGIQKGLTDDLRQSPASEWMNSKVDTLQLPLSIREAIDLFRTQRHGSYPVVDEENKLLGVLKRDDIYDAIKQSGPGAELSLEAFTLRRLPTLPPDLPGEKMIDLFLRSGKNKLLVTDADGHLLGLITLLDVLARIDL